MAMNSVRGIAAADLVALLAEQPADTLKEKAFYRCCGCVAVQPLGSDYRQ